MPTLLNVLRPMKPAALPSTCHFTVSPERFGAVRQPAADVRFPPRIWTVWPGFATGL
ncbi:MAG: hypothetical protein SYR96_23850 [Actinomycetota bacterium]|nr:hypothetical protein [Actinomycetota bacterium]